MKKKPSVTQQMNWRPTAEDVRLIQELRARLGVSDADILRLGIRALATQQKIISTSKAAD